MIKSYIFSKPFIYLLCVLLLLIKTTAHSQNLPFKINDSLCAFSWTQIQTDTLKKGYYSLTQIVGIDSTQTALTYSTEMRIVRSFWWQRPLGNVANAIKPMTLAFIKNKPDSIRDCSPRFLSKLWTHTLSSPSQPLPYTIRFYFPVLPMSENYYKFDYFTVTINDTMNLDFQCVADSIFIGSFTLNDVQSIKKTKIYAKDAIVLHTTKAQALRIGSVYVNSEHISLISQYIGLSLSALISDNVRFAGILSVNSTSGVDAKNVIPPQIEQEALFTVPTKNGFKVFYTLPNLCDELYFSLFDLKGRSIDIKSVKPNKKDTYGSFIWENIPMKGFYILYLKSKASNSNKFAIIRKKILLIHN